MSSHIINKKNYWHWLELAAAIIIGVILLLMILAPVASGYYFKKRLFPGTAVAGVDVSGMTMDQALLTLDKKFKGRENNKIIITLNEMNYSYSFQEMDIKYEYTEVLREEFARQREQAFWQDGINLAKNFILQKKNNKPARLIVNNNKVETIFDGMLLEINHPAKDAVIKVANNQLVIEKEIYGIGVDKEILRQKFLDQLRKDMDLPSNIRLSFKVDKLEPKIKESDLTEVKIKAELMTKDPIYLTFEDKKYSFENKQIVNWLVFNSNNGSITPNIKRSAVEKDVAIFSKKVDIKPIEKQISSVDGKVLREGKDGRALNRAKVVNDIIAILDEKNSTEGPTYRQAGVDGSTVAGINTETNTRTIALEINTQPFPTKTMLPPFTPGMYPGKYIEINLTQQKMYLWNGQTKVKEYRVSSGRRTMPTRTGVFHIKNKATVGKSYPWIMPYWMAFAQDRWGAWQGIHELPIDMRTGLKEGAWDIGLAVSHGCVRLAVGDAKAVYNWAEIGIPVYIHK